MHSNFHKWKTFYKGNIHLNGDDALNDIRMHKHGPRGDMERNERQVVALVMKKGTNVTNMTKFAEMIDILEHHVETNLDQAQMKKIFTRYRHTKRSLVY
ncbi:LCP family glycopolymer transferase [Cerasibacillus quisquiliarum]|uniref:LCP family glycopolymer transferase n=1 Tax=Cerasibacillus quisquiliarum TaxID=227865 RepID=UPI0035315680